MVNQERKEMDDSHLDGGKDSLINSTRLAADPSIADEHAKEDTLAGVVTNEIRSKRLKGVDFVETHKRQSFEASNVTGKCAFNSPQSGSMVRLNEEMEPDVEQRFVKVNCWLEEDRWEWDTCRTALQADGNRGGPWMPLPWSTAETGLEVNGSKWTRFLMQ